MKNYYRVLGLRCGATKHEVKKAFRAIAKEAHPDKGGDGETFQEAKEAYDVLVDTDAREEYEADYIAEAERLGHVVCPDCFTKNRVARFERSKIVKCGFCKTGLDLEPEERNDRMRQAIAAQTSELVEVIGVEGSELAKDAIRHAADWTRRKLGIGRG